MEPGLKSISKMNSSKYYRFGECQSIKQIYSSWVGKRAHLGNGRHEILKCIHIKQKKSLSPDQKKSKYKVEFEFENNEKMSALEFFTKNGLWQMNFLKGKKIKL